MRPAAKRPSLSRLLQTVFQLHGSIPRLLGLGGRAFRPIHLLIEVTYRCNLRCDFCQYLDIIEGRAQPHGPSPNDLSLAVIKHRIDELPHGRLITFAGGETMVRKDFPEILAHAAKRHRVHVITNGTLITEEVAERYVALAPRHLWQNGLVLLEVSLEGGEDLHDRVVQRKGSWRKSIDGLRRLEQVRRRQRKSFPKLDLKMVVTRHTVTAMVDLMHLAKGLGVGLVNFLAEHDLVGHARGGDLARLETPQKRPMGVDPAYLREQLVRCYALECDLGVEIRLTPYLPIDEFVRHYTDDRTLDPREYVCDGPWSRLAVAADGRYGAMCHYSATGDSRTQRLREIWNGVHFRSFRRETARRGVYPGCNGCCNLTYQGSKAYGLRGVEPSADRAILDVRRSVA